VGGTARGCAVLAGKAGIDNKASMQLSLMSLRV
jgi:hypothetical protein